MQKPEPGELLALRVDRARPLFEKWLRDEELADKVAPLPAPIYYFTMSAQIQAPIQRIYCMNKPGKLKKMALLASSYSPNVYDGAIGEYRGILNYWGVEDTGVVTAKNEMIKSLCVEFSVGITRTSKRSRISTVQMSPPRPSSKRGCDGIIPHQTTKVGF